MTPILWIELAGGLAWLLIGGDFLVRGAVALARRFHVSPMVIALTVVAFGTSLPELVVVVEASLNGYPGLVFGNVVGSNIANVLLVMGTAAVVYPVTHGDHSVRRDYLVMVAATLLLIGLSANGTLSVLDGVMLLGGLIAVNALTAKEAAQAYREASLKAPLEWVLGLPSKPRTIALFIVVGAIGLPAGAHLVVGAAVEIASNLGVSETVIGLTVLAIGTSLPELATTVVAAVQKRPDVAIGTVVGSNTFNILAILGVGAVISSSPVGVAAGFATLDFPVMLGVALTLGVFVWIRRPIGRTTGIMFLVGYVGYIVTLALRAGGALY